MMYDSAVRIYTKTGDDGSTGLADGTRVSKAALRVGAYGDVDELNAAIGMLRADTLPRLTDERLAQVQSILFEIGAMLADPRGSFALSAEAASPEWLERWIDEMQQELPLLENFVLPGGCRPAALAHVARTVCRRGERHVIALAAESADASTVVPFLNRLSDTLFVLARWFNLKVATPEVAWRGRT